MHHDNFTFISRKQHKQDHVARGQGSDGKPLKQEVMSQPESTGVLTGRIKSDLMMMLFLDFQMKLYLFLKNVLYQDK